MLVPVDVPEAGQFTQDQLPPLLLGVPPTLLHHSLRRAIPAPPLSGTNGIGGQVFPIPATGDETKIIRNARKIIGRIQSPLLFSLVFPDDRLFAGGFGVRGVGHEQQVMLHSVGRAFKFAKLGV